MLNTLDHLVIAVRDLADASGTYERLLGRRPSWRGRHPGYGTANTLFRLERTYLELLALAGEGAFASLLSDWLDGHGEGLFALAFGTGDAAASAAELRKRGLDAADPAEGNGREEASGALRSWRNVFLPTAETRGVQLFAIEHLTPADRLPVALAIGAEEATLSGVDHVVVSTPAPDASSRLYGEQLGLRLALDRTFADWGARLLFFRVGGITVELAARLDALDPAAPDRLWGISYRTADVAAARERLAGAGFDVSEVRQGRRPGTRVFTVRGDPCGVATLVIGPG